MRTLAVVGGGVIGLGVAWRAAEAGWSVTLCDPAVGSGASWVAGGMLAPLSEGWPGEDRVLDFGAAALARWPEFAARIEAATGVAVLVADATLTVALDAADLADLRTVADWVGGRGHDLRLLDRAGVRALEPSLARTVRAGLHAPAEPAIDNRRLVAGLRQAAEAAGVRIRAERVDSLDALDHDQIVLAAGAASARLWPALPVRPVKGEILRLRQRPGVAPAPQRVIRARVHGRAVYLVPRADGIVVGATQYEAGFDTTVTVAGVRDLIADAEAIFPSIGEYELAEASAGARPGTPDNLPLLGRLTDRIIAATGHGRNGMLTMPLTVDAVLAQLAGTPLPEAEHADPQRFSTAHPPSLSSAGGVR
ncbi:glycine oxidase ThiO [Nocardia brasiliensis]|uniref:glycine oxidase n=1 Tax=Nocardia brasiliensis (strain ATCC 700358 / HUJEG-1) TaxID=1133849 RepID=K0FE14_NOCB7|nr:glycine oxidase ThiO [Nocardia brasiliensis]AFU05951.1 putative thiamine biosynthesis oxidoreductase thiO [Nocardia brasiliensis ATCC 700358]OCF90232.1 glycine oxidase [Nocardia brasiliensis]